jgi:hypothetical protein
MFVLLGDTAIFLRLFGVKPRKIPAVLKGAFRVAGVGFESSAARIFVGQLRVVLLGVDLFRLVLALLPATADAAT